MGERRKAEEKNEKVHYAKKGVRINTNLIIKNKRKTAEGTIITLAIAARIAKEKRIHRHIRRSDLVDSDGTPVTLLRLIFVPSVSNFLFALTLESLENT